MYEWRVKRDFAHVQDDVNQYILCIRENTLSLDLANLI